MTSRLGLTGRLALFFTALALLAQYLNYQSFEGMLQAVVQQRELDKIKAVSTIIGPRITHDVDWVRATARLIHNELATAMLDRRPESSATIARILDQAYATSGVDLLQVTDARGLVLYRAHDPERRGDLATAWGIEEALAGSSNAVSERNAEGTLIAFIEPLRDGTRVIGTLTSGTRIDANFITRLSAESGAELALADRDGKILAASRADGITADPAAITEAFQEKIPIYRTNAETRTTVAYLPLLIVDEAWVMIAEINSASAFRLLDESSQKAALLSFLIIACGVFVILSILYFSLRPLRQLRRRAEQMAAQLSGKETRNTPGDDIISLVSTLDTLTSTLIEKNNQLSAQQADLLIAAAAFEGQQGMMITDAQRRILRVNKAYSEITGYTAEEVIGQTPRIFTSHLHSAELNRSVWDALQDTGRWQGEVQDRRKSGESYPKWIALTVLKNDAGEVTHYIISHTDISERKSAEEKIEKLAFYDPLTLLPNRQLLTDRLQQAISACQRNASFGALLFINLDSFKTLNDTLGHHHGDVLLQQVAQRLLACTRADNTVARIGGDEFVVVLSGLGSQQQEAATQTEFVGDRILSALNYSYHVDDFDHLNSASIGATLFGAETTSLEDLLRQADLAMYKSKTTGRNTLSFFDPAMQTIVMERAYLENALREALSNSQFSLHYQPQVGSDGRVTGAEALLRWQHPERGMISPAAFIPLAEETGLILPLGHWVLESACQQLVAWSSAPDMAQLTIAVNVSARQFLHPDFVHEVLTLLDHSGANPHCLKLELTESMLVENVEEIIGKMHTLQQRGVCFSLDDFGTGYSSLSYLKRLPLEQLKIDQSFVRDVLDDPNDAAIAKTIVTLAHSLGLKVIAEGVETEAQRDFLYLADCHAYQGYLFSRPLPVEQFTAFFRARLKPV
jgi:diguanylate cyclase (GGDEF)-like protein/PAS domain S-box-containing protein